jgi:hypothetical protein
MALGVPFLVLGFHRPRAEGLPGNRPGERPALAAVDPSRTGSPCGR